MKRKITKTQFFDLWWDEFCADKSMTGVGCMLCGSNGSIDTRGKVFTAAGVECGGLAFCICPNGRALKRAHEIAIARQEVGQ
ncbi:hypothetical protein [Sphingomonas aerophila]|uniref:Uncharacterized protein n=1 Tax=Sphingomonas aerophila TaxID=1344948 RepID=A0A7W9BES6_9SPHN|nr:hypothetical protein [Sphingomonas aerophila]MBB5715832.1 hypothetical protein [Sphingomonas aerophila]